VRKIRKDRRGCEKFLNGKKKTCRERCESERERERKRPKRSRRR
jgi:hypothetical protein